MKNIALKEVALALINVANTVLCQTLSQCGSDMTDETRDLLHATLTSLEKANRTIRFPK